MLNMNTSIFSVISRSKVVWNRCFGTNYRSHLQGSSCPRSLKMEQIGSPETSVSNHLTPRNSPEGGRIQFNRGRSLLSRKCKVITDRLEECNVYIFRVIEALRLENVKSGNLRCLFYRKLGYGKPVWRLWERRQSQLPGIETYATVLIGCLCRFVFLFYTTRKKR